MVAADYREYPTTFLSTERVSCQGVVKALFECGMLPTVLSGSSVGSISALINSSSSHATCATNHL